jgi:hypothetical protein
MTMLSFYFIGGSLSLFTIFIVGLYAYNSFSSILNVNNGKNYFNQLLAFKMFENHEYSIIQYKLIYIAFQSLVVAFVLYRIYGMGLIPLNPADWISLIETKIPPTEVIQLK